MYDFDLVQRLCVSRLAATGHDDRFPAVYVVDCNAKYFFRASKDTTGHSTDAAMGVICS